MERDSPGDRVDTKRPGKHSHAERGNEEADTQTSRVLKTREVSNRAAALPPTRPLATSHVTFTLDLTASNVLTGVADSSVAWGDYDNDGDLDILLSGYDNGGTPITHIYDNQGDRTFVENVAASNVLTGVFGGSVAWGDYDNDGDLDILLSGLDSSLKHIAHIYDNQGDKTFAENITASNVLTGVGWSSVAWGDYDNDGDLDILLSGWDNSYKSIAHIYDNKGGGDFTENVAASNVLAGVAEGSVAWGDYDNDGDLDILLSGEFNDYIKPIAHIYDNQGGGDFTENVTASTVLTGVLYSSVAWGDYDNDGDLDILLAGRDPGGKPITHIYDNQGGGDFTENVTASNVLTGVRLGSVAWGDYDNDGHLDILLTGQDSNTNPIAHIYDNQGDKTFTENVIASNVLPGVCWGSVAWGDYDNDGDLDILLTGHDGSKPIASLFRNNAASANTPPAAPTGLGSNVDGQQVELSWAAASDSQTITATGLTYNLRVGTSPGLSDTLAPMSCLGTCGSGGDGYRQIPQMGAANHGLTATLTLPYGTYYWSVQAIDHNFSGSPWPSEDNFTIDYYDLAVSKTAAFTTISPTTTITYTISVHNIDTVGATSVVISDTLPLSITFVASSTTNGSIYTPTSGVWAVGNVAVGTGVTMTLVVTANLVSGQTITNTAALSNSTPADTTNGNNSSSAGVTAGVTNIYLPIILKN